MKSIIIRPKKLILLPFIFTLVQFSLLANPFHVAASEGNLRETGECLAIGEAPVVAGDSAQAKKRAIKQALIKGVEDYIVNLLGSRAAVAYFDRLTRDILPAAQQEIQNFHILAEQQVNDRYRVLLKLQVNEDTIQEQLRSFGVVPGDISSPVKVLFLVTEVKDGDLSYWWKDPEQFGSLNPVALALHHVFQGRGFTPVNRTLSLPDISQQEILTSPDLSDEGILEWGRIFSADVVISGRCTIETGREIALTLQAWDMSQGIRFCREFMVEPIDYDPEDTEAFMTALKGMINRMSASLCPCIRQSIGGGQSEEAPIVVTLAGMRMPNEFWQFSEFLKKEIAGVTSVIPCRIKANAMSATVVFQGGRDRFINRVLNHPGRPFPLRVQPNAGGPIIFVLE